MNEHRPAQIPATEGNSVADGLQHVTKSVEPQHSWLDDVRKSAYSFGNSVKDTAEHAPVGTALGALAIGVAAYGAIRTGLPGRALTALAEGEALAAGSEAVAASGETMAASGKTMVHLTTAEGEIGIANTLKIGSRWGVFGLDSAQVPENALVRKMTSLVPKELTGEVAIGPKASSYFKSPTPIGPFSLARNLAGVKSTPLGSIDLARDAFIPNEIFANGVFRQATGREVANYKVHQWLLDYGIDSLAYSWAGFTTAAAEYEHFSNKADKRQTKWQSDMTKDVHK
jgi:hypothetical protein